MSRKRDAYILGEIIRLAKRGLSMAKMAGILGIKPSEVYDCCKLYGIKTVRMIERNQHGEKKKKFTDSYQLSLFDA